MKHLPDISETLLSQFGSEAPEIIFLELIQ